MIRADVGMPSRGMVETYRRYAIQTYERAAIRTVSRVSRIGKSDIRADMRAASLGRLGNAIDANSDADVFRMTSGGFSASARFFIRSRSERTLGAIKAYTEGTEITPTGRNGRWLWIPTDDIPRVSKRKRLTPAMWRQNGFDKEIGKLFQIASVNGNPLLVTEDVSVSAAGRSRSAKSLTKSGRPRKGQVHKRLLVAFVGIPRTSRSARVNITETLKRARAQMGDIFPNELAKERR